MKKIIVLSKLVILVFMIFSSCQSVIENRDLYPVENVLFSNDGLIISSPDALVYNNPVPQQSLA